MKPIILILLTLIFTSINIIADTQTKSEFSDVSIEEIKNHFDLKFKSAKYHFKFKEKLFFNYTIEYRNKIKGKVEKIDFCSDQKSEKYSFTFITSDDIQEKVVLKDIVQKTFHKMVTISYKDLVFKKGILGTTLTKSIFMDFDFLENYHVNMTNSDLLIKEGEEIIIYSQSASDDDRFIKVSIKFTKNKENS
ncbi:hypothetical protein LNTAR_15367 [Lentisphaera araneosa HTCC2155]|uniref:Uncharacterized protein n=1 Tax=Lentisphaera araneosa HTCC2155 TaxID=313628 RepID=A6DU58_9BACT|nr:hypothetical protein [Lentisphaera araneosa]EDM24817.1 hypothetical protein LNTAR_15367 [Lentisphaera araneosa HTCC2155]